MLRTPSLQQVRTAAPTRRSTMAEIEDRLGAWLGRHSVTLLRISLGAVFLGFGVLKFFPGVSPAENIATETMSRLTFGLIPPGVSIYIVATLESVIGILLLSGLFMRAAFVLLVFQFVGIFAPLVVLTGRLFAGPNGAPTLEGQYVIKDIVLLAAALVVLGAYLAKRTRERAEATTTDDHSLVQTE